ncbi:MAG TPA: DUF3048 domain-containing protein [Acidimicrobiales bacterium]|nr:DUF3048 domain-containing protein [Acidimicrobiales bacterium]
MRTRLMPRSAPALVVLVATLGLLASACSRSDESGSAADEGPKAPSPLTGLPIDADVAARPAVTVKVDNSPEGRPQSGLHRADVVIEEKVEGTITRFLAVFQSEEADEVGPVRSVRSTDVALMSPIRGVFAFSGGIAAFESLINKAPVTVVTEKDDAEAFDLHESRQRPFKTYTSTTKLRSRAADESRPPARLFEFLAAGQAFSAPGAAPAVHATVVFGPRTTATWDYDRASGRWRRSTNGTVHVVEGGGTLEFTNLIVQRTRYRTTVYRDRSGARVDEADVVGSGEALVLSQGQRVRARWSKPSMNAPTTYSLPDGTPLRLVPGRTWVGLPPDGATVTTR